MKDCTFCKLYEEKASDNSAFYEGKYFWAKFDRFPVSPGHAEIIPIRHIESILDLNDEEWRSLHSTLNNVIEDIRFTDLRELYTKLSQDPINKKLLQDPINKKSQEFCERMLNHIGLKKGIDAYNIGINEGEAAGRTVHHLHIHIIPRYFGDVENPTGGVRNIIPGMGNYK